MQILGGNYKVLGESEVICGFWTEWLVGTPNPHAVQGLNVSVSPTMWKEYLDLWSIILARLFSI